MFTWTKRACGGIIYSFEDGVEYGVCWRSVTSCGTIPRHRSHSTYGSCAIEVTTRRDDGDSHACPGIYYVAGIPRILR